MNDWQACRSFLFLLVYSRVLYTGGFMRSRLQQIRRIVEKEVPAWLGMREDLDLEIVLVSKTLPEAFQGKIVPRLAVDMKNALDTGRLLVFLFLQNRNASDNQLRVITIDRKFDRVDRALSSSTLLRDAESELEPTLPSLKTYSPFDVDAVREYEYPRAFTFVYTVGKSLLQIPYLSLYDRRQKDIAKQFGHSRRFESLIQCLSPGLDSELHALFPKALHALWEHDEWLNRQVNVAAAENALFNANVYIVTDSNAEWNSPHDPGPEIETRSWTNDEGENFAWAEVYSLSDLDPSKIAVHVVVFGSHFSGDDARRLFDCHREKTVKHVRSASILAPGCGHA